MELLLILDRTGEPLTIWQWFGDDDDDSHHDLDDMFDFDSGAVAWHGMGYCVREKCKQSKTSAEEMNQIFR